MSFSYASVIEIAQVGDHIRRIRLQIDDPFALDVKQAGDSAVGVYFPVVGPDGRRTPPPADHSGDGRNYSVRRQDGDVIDLDIVLHAQVPGTADGPGAAWAAATAVGERVGLDHARSWYRPEPTTEWQLLVTDLSGLPATARIIEQHSGDTPLTAIVEVVDATDLDYLPTHPMLSVIPSVGTGNGHTRSRLAEMVCDFVLPQGRGYCWFAGEAAQSRATRKYFRGLGWTVEQLDVTGYWRYDSETWDARYALVAEDVEAVYVKALEDGKGDKVADEEYDEALERAGL